MRRRSTLLMVLLCLTVLLFGGLLFGEIGEALFGIDPPSWLAQGDPEIHLPAGEITKPVSLGPLGDFAITNTMLACWLTTIVLVGFFYIATRKSKLVPGRIQALVEWVVELLLNFVEGVAGKENARKFFPVIATIFLFVIFNAYLALLPFFGAAMHHTKVAEASAPTTGIVASIVAEEGETIEEGNVMCRLESGEEITAPVSGEVEHIEVSVGDSVVGDSVVASVKSDVHLFRSANTDLNLPLAMALIAVFFVEYWGMSVLGRGSYLTSNFFNVGPLFRSLRKVFTGRILEGLGGLLGGCINAFVGMLEVISHLGRVVSFSFRLFGNMTAGEILLVMMTFLVPFLMPLPFYGLELLVGLIQALVFAGLTLAFATIAATPHEHEEE